MLYCTVTLAESRDRMNTIQIVFCAVFQQRRFPDVKVYTIPDLNVKLYFLQIIFINCIALYVHTCCNSSIFILFAVLFLLMLSCSAYYFYTGI